MNLPATALLDPIRHTSLLPPERLKEAERLAVELAEAKALADALVERGWVTAYQGAELSEGRGYGLLFGPYVLMDKLGEGGFGEVFRAWQRHMECERALKRMHPHLARRPEFVARFKREGRAVARLSSGNVVKIHDVNEAGGTYYLAMEYLRGVNLAEHLARLGSLPVAEAVEYVRQACVGMQHAHEQGIVHRDLKPGNLMLTQGVRIEERIKILDLGLARLPTDERLSETGQFFGTAEYASPEQTCDFSRADVRADVYSLGCTLYHALTGRPPFSFRGVDWETRIRTVKHVEPPPIEGFRDNVPREVADAVRKMMAKDREQRYQTPGEAAAALEALTRAASQGSGRAEAVSSANRVAGSPESRSPETEPPERIDSVPAPRLAIRCRCPKCGAKLSAPGEVAGRKVRCPKCQEKFTVAEPESPIAARSAREGNLLPAELTNSIGMRFVLVKPGKFLMGSPTDEEGHDDHEKQHEVTLTKAFYLAVCPVTQGQWKAVMGNNPSGFSRSGGGKDRVEDVSDAELDLFPVEQVSWQDAQAFLKELAAQQEEAKNRREYRLPSEAEWEYACRGGHLIQGSIKEKHTLPFHFDQPFSSLSSTQANFNNDLGRPSKVGSYRPNALGLFDMHGNVWEWCHDWFGDYPSAPTTDPRGPSGGSGRVDRGGSWYGTAGSCRCAYRSWSDPGNRFSALGFRVVLVPAQG